MVTSRLQLSLSLTQRNSNREDRNVNETRTGKHNRDKNNKTDRSHAKKSKNNHKDNITFIPEDRIYQKEVWLKLSRENQEKVRALYRTKKDTRNMNSTKPGTDINQMVPYYPPRHMN